MKDVAADGHQLMMMMIALSSLLSWEWAAYFLAQSPFSSRYSIQ